MEYKAYSFDLDDNLLKLPTKIYLKDKSGKTKAFSTLEFERIRPNLEELNLKVTKDSFKDFFDDKKFLIDINKATKAGSFKNLEKCVTKHASIFAIITARGHAPKALKKGLKQAILKNISKTQLEKFHKTFSEKYKIKSKTIEESLDKYLDLCKFYPTNNPEIKKKFGSTDTSELKSLAFEEFQKYIKKYVAKNFGEKTEVKIGFSDDSMSHLKKMVNNILKKHGLFFYRTGDDGKSLY